MSTVIDEPSLSRDEAERLSTRISLRLDTASNNWNGALDLIREAIEKNAYRVLGYRSHGDFVADRFGGALGKLGIELRRLVVRELSDDGLSTRAIAPIVGVSQKTVVKDRQETEVIPEVSPEPEPPAAPITGLPPEPIANPLTGEVIEPVVVEHTETVKTKTVTGLDGKVYAQQTALHAAEASPEIQAAKYVLAFSKAMTRADDFLEFDPERIGRLSAESIESVEGLLKSTEHFLARMRPGLRIVGGDR